MSNSPKRAFGSSAKSKRKEMNLDLSDSAAADAAL